MKRDFLIKLLVCYHKPDYLLKDDILTPIHVGRALAKKNSNIKESDLDWMIKNTIGDDTGDNISDKNQSFNEMTAIYWAWKNYNELGNPDYIGFMHYRRHFIFRDSDRVVENINSIDDDYFDYINYNKEVLNHILEKYDFVAYEGKVAGIYKHYKRNHNVADLDLALNILKNKYPNFAKIADKYMEMENGNFCNMFILPRKLFFEYCEWIFSILFEFEKNVDLTEKRLFISERLTGIYLEYLKSKGYKQKSLSTTFVESTYRIPIAFPYTNETSFELSVTMLSVLKHLSKNAKVDFYLLHQGELDKNKVDYDSLLKKYEGNRIIEIDLSEYINLLKSKNLPFTFPKDCPLILSHMFNDMNKIIYMDTRILLFGDIGNLYKDCNNDEFKVLGLLDSYKKTMLNDFYSINCNRIRKHFSIEDLLQNSKDKSSSDVFNEICKDNFTSISNILYNLTTIESDSKLFYKVNRGDKRQGVWNKPVLCFCDGMNPLYNVYSLYSIYWWEVARDIPSEIKFTFNKNIALQNMREQLTQLCASNKSLNISGINLTEFNYNQDSEQKKKLSLTKRARIYYKKHGLLSTIKKIFKKVLRIK